MLASLKTRLRQMRREGRAVTFINRLAYLNYQIKNLRDWMGPGACRKCWENGPFPATPISW